MAEVKPRRNFPKEDVNNNLERDLNNNIIDDKKEVITEQNSALEEQNETQPSQLDNLPTEDDIQKEAESGSNFFTRLFPVARAEIVYLVLGCAIFFSLAFVYSLMKITKNAIMADKLDASSIPYLKVLLVLPANIFVVALTQGIVGRSTVSRAFDVIVLAFSAIFLVYGLSFMKLEEIFNFIIDKYFTRDIFADNKMTFLGLDWTYALFSMINFPYVIVYYLVAELHGSVVIQYLFWSLCNQFFSRKQSLRLNPIFIIAANIALISTTWVVDILEGSVNNASTFFKAKLFNTAGLFCCFFFNTLGWAFKFYGEKKVFSKPIFKKTGVEKAGPKKVKVGLKQAIEIIWKVRFVLLLSFSVLGYSVISNFIETFANRTAQTYGVKKGNVKKEMQDLEGYSAQYTAISTIILCLIPSHHLITHGFFSIYAYASCVLTLISVVFFVGFVTINRICLRGGETIAHNNPFSKDEFTLLKLEAYFGCIFRTVQKVLKYAAFDIFKEALSMRIDSTYRAIFKGVYDGQINKLGKAIGALLTIILNVVYQKKDITASSIPVFIGMLIFSLLWFIPTYILIKQFNKSNTTNTNIEPGWKGGKPLF